MSIKNKYEDIFANKSIYCYPETMVFVNKLGIIDKKLMDNVERTYTTYKLSKMQLSNKKVPFNINGYLEIHKYLFDDLYDFAGKLRLEEIAKKDILFCRPEFIYKYLKCALLEMNKESININDEMDLVKFLARHYGEINIIHPFREGNGRVQREYFRQYMSQINEVISFDNYELKYSNWSSDDKKEFLDGCFENAFYGSTVYLEKSFEKALVKKK